LRVAMGMVAAGHALVVPGNHENKLLRALRGHNVQITHGLAQSLEQLAAEPPEFRSAVEEIVDGLVSHYVLDEGRLWPLHGIILGTLLRTCDAVGACMAVPRLPWVPEALARGNTLRRPACVHWTGYDVEGWLRQQQAAGSHLVGVEIVDEAIALADLPVARRRTVAVVGHEQTCIPPDALDLIDLCVEIPMVGTGASLNVAVAGSLVLYRLAGLL
jgi:tRNA (guanosine-2'-O-)-methyltransferase